MTQPHFRRAILSGVFLALVSPSVALAQTGTASSQLEPVVVTATRTERQALDVPASVDLIERDAIRDAQLRVNLSESLGRVPGIVVLDRQNYAQDLQISVRGFGSRATFGVRGIRLYVDGVPASFPDGQGQVSHFPLNAAERIEVLRGPFSALYGNSSGGVIAVTTGLKSQPVRFELSAAGGSNATWRGGLAAAGGASPYAYAFDAAHFSTDGARPHSAAERETVNLRAGAFDTPLGRVRLSITALSMPDSQDPLGLTRGQFDVDPDQAAPAALQFNTRKTTRQTTAGADVETPIGARARLNVAAWIGSRDVEQFQAIPVATQANPRHPGGVIDFDRSFGGADVRATWDAQGQSFALGLNAERMREQRRGYENFVGAALGVKGLLRRDETNRVDAVAAYAQAESRLTEKWIVHGGARASRVRFESRDRYIVGVNGDDSGDTSFSSTSPTLGLVFRPAQSVALYASYGRGFETPTFNELAYRADGSAGLNTALRAARSNNLEIGAKLNTRALRAALALFAIETRDDLVVLANSGGRSSFGNVGRTKREGAEATFYWRPMAALDFSLAASIIDARFDSGFLTCGPPPCTVPNVPVAAGNKLPGVPARTLFAQLRYRVLGGELSAQGRAQSGLFVDDRNADRAAGYGVFNLSAARTFDFARSFLRAFVRLDNAFDRRYAGSVIVNEANGRFFETAPGRTWLVGVDAAL